MRDLHFSLRREGDRIYLLINLIEYGYWTKDDFARFRDFSDRFWAGDFEQLILPRLHEPEPSCANCEQRGEVIKDANVAHGAPLCSACYGKVTDEMRARLEGQLKTFTEREGES